MPISPCRTTTDLHQRELVEHGAASFPIACYADDFSADVVPWHWHDELEFAIITQGTPAILLENTRLVLAPGEGIFINGGALHAVDDPEKTGALHSAVFHPRLVGGATDSVYWQKLVLPLTRPDFPRYVRLNRGVDWQAQVLEAFHAAWESVAREGEDWENRTRYLLSKALGLLIARCGADGQPPTQRERVDAERIRAMLEYIDGHYNEELTLAHIARSAAVSTSVCLRCFQQTLGLSPIQYLKSVRLERAAQLLRSEHMTSKEAALSCGFNDVSYFTRAFREKMGCAPGEYRRRMLR